MSNRPEKTIDLTENTPALMRADLISPALEEWLGQRYSHILEIQPPSFQTGQKWRMVPRSWVGQIPLPDGRLLVVNPKIHIQKLFAMMAAVYELAPLHLLPGSFKGQTIPEFYDFLALRLLDGIHSRMRHGMLRSYERRHGRPSSVRGRIDLKGVAHDPVSVLPLSHYQLYTADNAHNQLLAWTLLEMSTAPFDDPEIARRARFLARRLPVTIRPFSVEEANSLSYNRLNEDYELLHRLCRFFLAQIGPSHQKGRRKLTPFLIEMSRLFERYVAVWLRDRLPGEWRLTAQAPIGLNLVEGDPRRLSADIVLHDPAGRPAIVLDTKYKSDAEPAMGDIYQVTFYAHEIGARQAVLVYPFSLKTSVKGVNQGVTYRALPFDLGGDLEEAGDRLLRSIFGRL